MKQRKLKETSIDNDDDENEANDFVEIDPTSRFFRYDVVLSHTPFTTVFKAYDDREALEVSWSVVLNLPLSDFLHRLLKTVGLLQNLHHPNIVSLFSFWMGPPDENARETSVHVITEHFSSGNLKAYRKKHAVVETKTIRKWAREILSGLAYLHSREPPILHRDLNCGNVFVNGSNAEVKIGLPDFLAAAALDNEEEEKYDEASDVYAFGLCVLEMVTTCEEEERKGGVLIALCEVEDEEVAGFIQKCLVVPASMRMSAVELLREPFLAPEDWKVLRGCFPKGIEDGGSSSCSLTMVESRRVKESGSLELKAERYDVCRKIFLTLIVADSCGKKEKKIEFDFDLDSDSAASIVEDMIANDLGLSVEDMSSVAEMIDELVAQIVPDWKPSSSAVDERGQITAMIRALDAVNLQHSVELIKEEEDQILENL